MKVPFFLIVNSNGTVRTTKNRPDLRFDEVSMQIDLSLPDNLFRKPQLSATITVPAEAATPATVSSEVVENVRQAIEQAAGMQVRITVEPHEEKQ